MTTFNFTNTPPPSVSGLTALGTDGGINLHWDMSSVNADLWGVEVWASTTNDRSTATLTVTERGSSYPYTTTPSTTVYFWIRSVNSFGFNNGAWYPTSSTAGISATSNVASSIPNTSSVTSGGISSGSGVAGGTLTNWSTWYNASYADFTVPSSGNGWVIAYGWVNLSFGTLSGVTSFNQTFVTLRVRLYDSTLSADVVNGTDYYTMFLGAGNTVQGSLPLFSFNFHQSFGQLGVLIPGHSYYVYIDVEKTRGDTTTTLSVSISGSSCLINSNLIS